MAKAPEIVQRVDIFEILEERFRSGNSIPVERAHLTAHEFLLLRAEFDRLERHVKEYEDTAEMWRQRYGILQLIEQTLAGQEKAN
jgi:hypothetical protein